MIKKLLTTLIILTMTSLSVFAANTKELTPEVARSIQKYKVGNYVGCMQELQKYFNKSNANLKNQLATYYMAMAYVNAGISDKAKEFYSLTVNTNPSSTLGQYAQKGIVCLDDPENCYINVKEEPKETPVQSELDKFINAPYGNGLSTYLNKEIERRKLERLRKEMNNEGELNKYDLKDFRKFTGKIKDINLDGIKLASSSKPTDAEIVKALRVLNAAGLNNIAAQAEKARNEQNAETSVKKETEDSQVKSEYKPDLTREQYQQQIQREMMQAQMAQMAQPNIDALFGEKNNQNNMMNNNMMNMLPFMMAQQAAQNANGNGNQQQMMTPEMMQAVMFNSMMPNMNFG